MIEIHADAEAMSHAAARQFVEAYRASLAREWFSVALSGAHTPQRTYALLAEAPWRDVVDWRRVQVFWGDERCVSPDDPRSNEGMARRSLLDHVPIPPSHIHPMRCGGDPEASALEYEAKLEEFFGVGAPRFDLLFLGLGDDGHTASLMPGTPALDETQRLVAAVRAPGVPLPRLTLTLPILDEARCVLFLVSGRQKARALCDVLENPSSRLPAARVKPSPGELLWFVDAEAASLLGRAAQEETRP